MRLLRIHGRNLASLQDDFTIDFEAPPLAHAGILAITGPTGAGKSTLLDAVCLALYDALPRTAGAGARGETRDLALNDGRRVLSHGAGEAEAEIDFIGRDGRRYRAGWSVRRARGRATGTLQAAKRVLIDLEADQVVADGKRDVGIEIAARIGLDFDQFRRSVLLAQGEFDAFLRADARDRADLLEKITGTGIYGRLSRAAFERNKAAQAEIDRIRLQLGEHQPLDETARAEAEATAEAARQALATARARQEVAAETLRRVDRRLALEAARTAAAEALEAARLANDAASPDRDRLARNRAALAARAELAAADAATLGLARARERLGAATTALARAAADHETASTARTGAEAAVGRCRDADAARAPHLAEARRLDEQLGAAAEALAQARRDAEAATETAAGHQSASDRLAAAIAEAQARETAARTRLAALEATAPPVSDPEAAAETLLERAPLDDELRRLTAGLDDLQARDRADAAETGRLAAIRDTAAARMAELTRAITAAEAEADQAAARALRRRRDRLVQIDHDLDDLSEVMVAAFEAARARDAHAATAEDATQAAAAATAEASRHRTALPVVEARLDEAGRAADLSAAAAEEHAGRLRALLIPGAPCPVCGSTDHPTRAVDDLLARRLEADRARLADLKAGLAALTTALARAEERARAETRRAADAATARDSSAETLAAATADHEALLTRLADAAAEAGLDALPPLPAAETGDETTDHRPPAARLAGWREAVVDAIEAAEARIAAIDAAATRAADLGRDHGAATRDRDAAAETLADLAARRAETGAAIARGEQRRTDLEARIARLDERLAALLDAACPDWRASLAADAAGFAALIRRRAAELAEAQATAEAARAEHTRLAPDHAAARVRAETAAEAAGRAATHAEDCARSHAALRDSRAALLDGRSVAAVEAEAEAARNAARLALDAALTRLTEAATAHARAMEARTQAEAAVTAAAETSAAADAALEAARAALDMDADTLRAVIAAGAPALDAEARRLDALARSLAEAEATLRARQEDLDRHLADPDTIASGADTALRAVAEAAHAEAAEACAAAETGCRQAEQRLAEDDSRRVAAGRLAAALADARAAADVWAQLNELIGAADGTKFRRFAQSLTLDRLVAGANRHLGELHPRYALRRMEGAEMALEVVDHDMADEARPVHNLSGGERFLVSLALALGLADISAGRGLAIESLFIDEGFGALDPDALAMAISMLERLQATGRRVAVISHVEALKDRIPVQIRVTPRGAGRSGVEVVAG
ncbi:AAA family ATPase [Tistrella mobilis]